MIRAAFEAEEVHRRVGLTAISRTRDRHLGAVDARAVPEKDDDVAVEKIAARVERQGRVGAEVNPIRADSWRERQVHATPASAAVAGKVTAHRQTKDFVRAAGQHLGRARVDGNKGLTLRSTFVRDVDVVAGADRRSSAAVSERAVLRQIGILIPPGRIM